MRIWGVLVGTLVLMAAVGIGMRARERRAEFVAGQIEWRLERERGLRKPDSWLSLVGLHWLHEGRQRLEGELAGLGELELRVKPKAPPGALEVWLRPASRAGVRVNGEAVSSPRALATDENGKPDRVEFGRLKLTVLKRSRGMAVRVKDPEARTLREFAGLSFYPPREEYRVRARLEPFAEPRTVRVPDVLGGSSEEKAPGALVFTLGGRTHRLIPIDEGADSEEYFVIFRDETTGKGTYPSGRFLYARKPAPGETEVTLDFNRAYSPPCAFTPYATCPLPPRENSLALAVEAGEKFAGTGH